MKKKILFVLSLLFGLLFINGGLNKFLNYIPVPADLPEEIMKDSMAMMEVVWLMPLIAIVEILGGILFIVPKYRALGAMVLFPIMVGILLTHLTAAPEGLPMALVLFAIHVWVIIENRQKYMPMVR